jgi:hypothetical protein
MSLGENTDLIPENFLTSLQLIKKGTGIPFQPDFHLLRNMKPTRFGFLKKRIEKSNEC